MQKHQELAYLEAIREGDGRAFAAVYDQYLARIYRFVLFKVPRRQDAEDLSAEVFLRAWQYLYHQQRPVDHIAAFLYQIARNLVVDFYRQRAQEGFPFDHSVLQYLVDDKQQQLFERVDQTVEFTGIARAVLALKDEYKEIILLRYVEELTVGEIARITGKSKGAVRVMLFRALQVLRAQVTGPQPGLSAAGGAPQLLSEQPRETTAPPPATDLGTSGV